MKCAKLLSLYLPICLSIPSRLRRRECFRLRGWASCTVRVDSAAYSLLKKEINVVGNFHMNTKKPEDANDMQRCPQFQLVPSSVMLLTSGLLNIIVVALNLIA